LVISRVSFNTLANSSGVSAAKQLIPS